jgi:hypothetical protein
MNKTPLAAMTNWLRGSIFVFITLGAHATPCNRWLGSDNAPNHPLPSTTRVAMRVLTGALEQAYIDVARARQTLARLHVTVDEVPVFERFRNRVFHTTRMQLGVARFLNVPDVDESLHQLNNFLRGFDLPVYKRWRGNADMIRQELMWLERSLRQVHSEAQFHWHKAVQAPDISIRSPSVWRALRRLLTDVERESGQSGFNPAEPLFWQQAALSELKRMCLELREEAIATDNQIWRFNVLNALDLTLEHPQNGAMWALSYAGHALADFHPHAYLTEARQGVGHPQQLVPALQALVSQIEQVVLPLLTKPALAQPLIMTDFWPMAHLSRPHAATIH